MDEHWTDPSVGWKCHRSFLIWAKIVCMGLLQCHIEDTVKKSWAIKKAYTVIVPGRCTKYMFKHLTLHGIRYLKPIAWKSIMIGWLQKKSIIKWKQAI